MHHDFDSLGVTFHPVVVIGLGKNLLFKSVLAHCATKIGKIFTINLTVCSNRQIEGEDFVNYCGLLRKHELIRLVS